MKAVVLAAGLSTRLLPLTLDIPKPMLPVGGKPFLEYVIRLLECNEFKNLLVTTHYQPHKIKDYFKDGKGFDLNIEYSYEPRLLDTAGSIKKNEACLGEDFLVVGGNYLLPTIDLRRLIEFHNNKGGIGTIVLKYEHLNPNDYGQALLDQNQQIVGYKEKPSETISHLINTTYQVYSPRIFKFIPNDKPCGLPSVVSQMIEMGEKIYGFVTDCDMLSVRTLDAYREANYKMERFTRLAATK